MLIIKNKLVCVLCVWGRVEGFALPPRMSPRWAIRGYQEPPGRGVWVAGAAAPAMQPIAGGCVGSVGVPVGVSRLICEGDRVRPGREQPNPRPCTFPACKGEGLGAVKLLVPRALCLGGSRWELGSPSLAGSGLAKPVVHVAARVQIPPPAHFSSSSSLFFLLSLFAFCWFVVWFYSLFVLCLVLSKTYSVLLDTILAYER